MQGSNQPRRIDQRVTAIGVQRDEVARGHDVRHGVGTGDVARQFGGKPGRELAIARLPATTIRAATSCGPSGGMATTMGSCSFSRPPRSCHTGTPNR